MNLLLHGLDAPQIDPGNALRFKLTEIGDRDRFDVILTNPPFGGEEEKGIQGNFPDDLQTSETALLFLQLIMRRLKRRGYGRAGVVVPESVMSDRGVAERIRRQLLDEMNLHTIVRMPKGVFEPYSDIQTNLLFFDTSSSTEGIWFYQHQVPEHRRTAKDPKYTITNPLKLDELLPVIEWYRNKNENDDSWYVSIDQIRERDCTFDFRNPRNAEQRTVSIGEVSKKTKKALSHSQKLIDTVISSADFLEDLNSASWPIVPLADLLERVRVEVDVIPEITYKQVTVRLYGKGVVERCETSGQEIKTRPQFQAHAGDLIMSRIDARNGAFGVIPSELDGAIVTQDFPMFRIREDHVIPSYLALLLKSDAFVEICKRSSRGTTNRKRLNEGDFLAESIPVAPTDIQQKIMEIAATLEEAALSADNAMQSSYAIERSICNMMMSA